MKDWSGHEPETATALLGILDGAPAGTAAPSDFERNFATACEIWSAAASGELASRLPPDPANALRDASEAFRYMGAVHASVALRRAGRTLLAESTPAERRAQLAVLADQLVSGVERIDALLSAQANGLLRRRHAHDARKAVFRAPSSSPAD